MSSTFGFSVPDTLPTFTGFAHALLPKTHAQPDVATVLGLRDRAILETFVSFRQRFLTQVKKISPHQITG